MCQPKWKKKIVESGDVIEEIIYLEKPISIKESNPKSKADKDRENLRRRVRDLGRIINANFSTGDYLITLTYSRRGYLKLKVTHTSLKSPRDIAYTSAKKELLLFLARCKYHAQKESIPFRAVFITSDIKGATGNYARVHHHMIVNKEALELVKKLWLHGVVKMRALRDQTDYTPIACYFIEQDRHTKNSNAYGHTNNLAKPIISEIVLMDPNETLIEPEGATVLSASRNQIKYTFKK